MLSAWVTVQRLRRTHSRYRRSVAVHQANYVEEGKSIQDLFLLHKKRRELNQPFEEDAVRRCRSCADHVVSRVVL